MKHLWLLLLLLLPVWARAETTAVEAHTAQKVGRPTWSVRVTALRYKVTEPWKLREIVLIQTEAARSGLQQRVAVEPLEWKIPHADGEALIAMLNKFNEWVKVAKTNNVKTFNKELGQVTKYGGVFTFYADNGKFWMQEKALYGRPLFLTEADVADALWLLSKLPELEKSITNPQPKNPTDALFK